MAEFAMTFIDVDVIVKSNIITQHIASMAKVIL